MNNEQKHDLNKLILPRIEQIEISWKPNTHNWQTIHKFTKKNMIKY